jgi:hypothetical protein
MACEMAELHSPEPRDPGATTGNSEQPPVYEGVLIKSFQQNDSE